MDTKKLLKHVPSGHPRDHRCFLSGGCRITPGRARQRPVDRGRVSFRLSCGLSLLQLVHRAEGHEARPDARHPGGH